MSATSSPAAPVHRILLTDGSPGADGPAPTAADHPLGAGTRIIDSHLGNAPGDETTLPGAGAAAETLCPHCGQESVRPIVATSSVSAEAEQGDGPAAASASASAVGEASAHTNTVSVVVGPQGAAAACPFGVVVVGPQGAAAASEVGVVAVGPGGVAASCNAANGSRVSVDGRQSGDTAPSAPSPPT
jgi:hypothetical protein